MNEHCHSCAAPLIVMPEFKGASDRYCKFCADASGTLHPKDAVQKEISV